MDDDGGTGLLQREVWQEVDSEHCRGRDAWVFRLCPRLYHYVANGVDRKRQVLIKGTTDDFVADIARKDTPDYWHRWVNYTERNRPVAVVDGGGTHFEQLTQYSLVFHFRGASWVGATNNHAGIVHAPTQRSRHRIVGIRSVAPTNSIVC